MEIGKFFDKAAKVNGKIGKAAKTFIYGKPHEERRLGDLYEDKTGLYKHREWRGAKDTFYYFNNIWLYNYANMVAQIMKNGTLPKFVKGTLEYRWMGQTYLTVMHWFDRGMEGMRGPVLRASAAHYTAMVTDCVRQICEMFEADSKLNNGEKNEKWYTTLCHDETVCGATFYPWRDRLDHVSLQMIPYFVSVHVNNHTVLNYIDAIQSVGVPSDTCPMCQAESGLAVLDDYCDYSPFMITSNEACDASVATSIIQDWYLGKPLYAMPQPMRFDDPLVQKNCQVELEGAWKFIEEKTGLKFDWDTFVKYIEKQNAELEFEREKWDVSANTDNYPINGVAQCLYRLFYSQNGYRECCEKADDKVRRIMAKCVKKDIKTFPKTRHRVLAWSCGPMFYSHWPTWAYNCWGLNVVMNMDSLMYDKIIRTDTYEHAVEDLATYSEWAPMRRMAVGGHEHMFEIWENIEKYNCDMVIMYDQIQCKGVQGLHGMFEDEFRRRGIHAIWVPHALPDKRVVTRNEIRDAISSYMTTVMHEEPLDPTLVDFDDSLGW